MLTPAMGTGNGLSNFSAFVALQETELRQFIKKHEEKMKRTELDVQNA
jgi:hypothetical protein